MTRQDPTVDTHFLTLVNMLCHRHNVKFEVEMESHIVNFITDGDAPEEFIEDMANLFNGYEC